MEKSYVHRERRVSGHSDKPGQMGSKFWWFWLYVLYGWSLTEIVWHKSLYKSYNLYSVICRFWTFCKRICWQFLSSHNLIDSWNKSLLLKSTFKLSRYFFVAKFPLIIGVCGNFESASAIILEIGIIILILYCLLYSEIEKRTCNPVLTMNMFL